MLRGQAGHSANARLRSDTPTLPQSVRRYPASLREPGSATTITTPPSAPQQPPVPAGGRQRCHGPGPAGQGRASAGRGRREGQGSGRARRLGGSSRPAPQQHRARCAPALSGRRRFSRRTRQQTSETRLGCSLYPCKNGVTRREGQRKRRERTNRHISSVLCNPSTCLKAAK